MRTSMLATVALSAVLLAAGCGGSAQTSLPQGSEPVELDPADFTSEIDNPWLPYQVGAKWVYRETGGEGGEQKAVVTVLDETREVMGIEVRVVHDVVTEDGELIEDTFDWYAQDADGNVWYFGEDTKEFENGRSPRSPGSWEAGVDGAQPGILVPRRAGGRDGLPAGVLRRRGRGPGRGVSVEEKVEVPFGRYDGVLMTKDYTPLEPEILEHKFYAQGVGMVLALAISGSTDREELVEYSGP